MSIYTWEGELDDAWVAAHELGCERRALLRLAKQSAVDRPEDALVVFQAEVAEVLSVTNRNAYAVAIGLLRRIEKMMDGLGRADDFRAYAAKVRAANKRRPAFCSMFDVAGFLR